MEYFAVQLLRVADLLYEAGLYSLARTHGYRKCLLSAGLVAPGSGSDSAEGALEDYVSNSDSEMMKMTLVSYLRAVWRLLSMH